MQNDDDLDIHGVAPEPSAREVGQETEGEADEQVIAASQTPSESLAVTSPSLTQPKDNDNEIDRSMARMTRRAFLVGGAATIAGASGLIWALGGSKLLHIPGAADADEIPWPLRRMHQANEKLSRATLGTARLAPQFPLSRGMMPRVNGLYGLDGDIDIAAWKLSVYGLPDPAGVVESVFRYTNARLAEIDPEDSSIVLINMDAIRRLPRVEMVTELKCIEGWSAIVHWGGARFSDFTNMLRGRFHGGSAEYTVSTTSEYPTKYAFLATPVDPANPDDKYYVGLDIESAMHPQTLLCYEMNGAPLEPKHGAPLRLVTTLKYGIKNIKRIGTLEYTDDRPDDYWAERGYDWYSGL